LQKEKESIQKAKASLENLLKTSKKINDKNLNKVIEEIEKALKGENLTINDILSLNNKLTDALNNVKLKPNDQTHSSNNASNKEKNKNRPDKKNKKQEDKNNKQEDKNKKQEDKNKRKIQGITSPKTGVESLSFVGSSLALSLSALFALKKKRK
ncbi:MAG: LPXTG cell wall anchor domain-containing protein, partial [Anaerococcus vaginalis]|nr:LPXTG cell wall anchor domain-containing protein [Anaerococcus vaginalis]